MELFETKLRILGTTSICFEIRVFVTKYEIKETDGN